MNSPSLDPQEGGNICSPFTSSSSSSSVPCCSVSSTPSSASNTSFLASTEGGLMKWGDAWRPYSSLPRGGGYAAVDSGRLKPQRSTRANLNKEWRERDRDTNQPHLRVTNIPPLIPCREQLRLSLILFPRSHQWENVRDILHVDPQGTIPRN